MLIIASHLCLLWALNRSVGSHTGVLYILGTRFGSTGTWYSPSPSAGEHHLPLVLVYHHDRRWVTSLLFFVVPMCLIVENKRIYIKS